MRPRPASLSCDGGSLRYPFPAAAINSFVVHVGLATLWPHPAKNSELMTSTTAHRIVRAAQSPPAFSIEAQTNLWIRKPMLSTEMLKHYLRFMSVVNVVFNPAPTPRQNITLFAAKWLK
jgi:hypothetical protein